MYFLPTVTPELFSAMYKTKCYSAVFPDLLLSQAGHISNIFFSKEHTLKYKWHIVHTSFLSLCYLSSNEEKGNGVFILQYNKLAMKGLFFINLFVIRGTFFM